MTLGRDLVMEYVERQMAIRALPEATVEAELDMILEILVSVVMVGMAWTVPLLIYILRGAS